MEELNLYFRGICDIFSIQQSFPLKIWDRTTADGGTSLLATRLLHNKPIILGTDILHCYLLPLDPYFLVSLIGILVTFLFFVGLFVLPNRWKVIYFPWLIIPTVFIFGKPSSIGGVLNFYKLYLVLIVSIVFIVLARNFFTGVRRWFD